jgi:hypothetical protein
VLCEAFGCTPSVAVDEPLGLALRILEMRSYARALEKQRRFEMAGDDEDVELDLDDPGLRLVWKVEEWRAAHR